MEPDHLALHLEDSPDTSYLFRGKRRPWLLCSCGCIGGRVPCDATKGLLGEPEVRRRPEVWRRRRQEVPVTDGWTPHEPTGLLLLPLLLLPELLLLLSTATTSQLGPQPRPQNNTGVQGVGPTATAITWKRLRT